MLAMTTFDNTGMKTTRVGFGAWAIGGGGWKLGWGEQDDADSVATIRAAIERGINWIDTAAIYGHGRSEQVVAEAIAGYPAADRPYILTKCGRVWDPADPTGMPQTILTPESIRGELEDSLRRLGVDCVDLYQVHWPLTDGSPVEDYGRPCWRCATRGRPARSACATTRSSSWTPPSGSARCSRCSRRCR